MQPTEFQLPQTGQNNHIPAMFNSATNSYKYFWFLGLLDAVRVAEEDSIPIRRVVHFMVLNAWYPILYFRLHFGKLDMLARAVDLLHAEAGLERDDQPEIILKAMEALQEKGAARKAVDDLTRYVPYLLLQPWFSAELRPVKGDLERNKLIQQLAAERQMYRNSAPLYFWKDKHHLRLTWDWRGYLIDHNAILRDFTYWRLAEFLQKRNPNVPNIGAKLQAPDPKRDHAKLRPLFQSFLDAMPGQLCIYSGLPLQSFDLDHFIPWSYVTHDLPWNLVPVHPKANNQKRDQLPDVRFLAGHSAFHHGFVRHLLPHCNSRNPHCNAYELFLGAAPDELAQWPIERFLQEMRERLQPMLVQARHQGFSAGWVYNP